MENQIWAMFYTTIIGWSYHPGYNREGARPPPSLKEAAAMADEMLEHYKRRYGGRPWEHGYQQ